MPVAIAFNYARNHSQRLSMGNALAPPHNMLLLLCSRLFATDSDALKHCSMNERQSLVGKQPVQGTNAKIKCCQEPITQGLHNISPLLDLCKYMYQVLQACNRPHFQCCDRQTKASSKTIAWQRLL
jgi:hypothetical protein